MKDKPESQKTTLRLDRDLHKRLRVLAVLRDTSFGALAEQALREFLEREEKKERGRK